MTITLYTEIKLRFKANTILIFLFLTTVAFARQGVFEVKEFSATGDGITPDTKAIQKAIDTCHNNGGGTVVVTPGVYVCGSLYLKSHVNLHLDPGATIKGSSRLEDYPLELDGTIGDQKHNLTGLNTGDLSLSGESDRAGLITAYNATNISITGEGIIDGSSIHFVHKDKIHWGVNEDIDETQTRQGDIYKDPKFALHDPLAHDERPGNLIRFISCVDVTIKDITFQNSPTWTCQIHRSENVIVSGVRINSFNANLRVPNDDGLNIQHSELIHISDCDIHTGDDAIAIFGSKKITVTNSSLSSRSSGIRVGDTRGDVQDCTFSNLIIYSANRALGVFVRASGSVENILFNNIIIKNQLFTGHWWGQGEPIHVTALPSDFFGFKENLGHIKNVQFKNIIAESESGIIVHGCKESIIENVRFENIQLTMKNSPLNDAFGGNFDLRHTTGFKKALFAHDIPGIYCTMAQGIEIIDFKMNWDENLPEFFTHAIWCEDFADLTVDGFKGKANQSEKFASIKLKDGRNVTIRNCKATHGTGVFLNHSDINDYRLFMGNDLIEAKTMMEPKKSEFKQFGNLIP